MSTNSQRDATNPGETRLIAAAREVLKLYPCHWDRVEGGLIVMPERVPQLDTAFNELDNALREIDGQPPLYDPENDDE